MLSITKFPSAIFSKLASKPGTYENFILHADQFIENVIQGHDFVAQQVKPTSTGANGSIQTGNYPDIFTNRPVTNFQPFFPSKDMIASQIKEVVYDSPLAVHIVPYMNFIQKPLNVGINLNITV